ncbi:MAG: Co2+/Mg2+ efflux protein ApaG [Flavobacteriales bacterium]|nr:Co2+/Mg2+ efflux protein ApaG [Flavobacteriales bacterium]
MTALLTEGVKVSVQTKFDDRNSYPDKAYFIFHYEITIENKNDFPVQLLRRHWFIQDSSREHREVEGKGVVGQQPILKPGEAYVYQSSCNLITDIGNMEGKYIMQRIDNKSNFEVSIPKFELIVPQKLN